MIDRSKLEKLGISIAQGKQQLIDLGEFMQTSSALFEECAEVLGSGTAREKDEMLKELASLQQTLESDADSLAKETGKTLEQMLVYVENPDNFPPDVWQTMQRTWRQIQRTSSRIRK